MKLFSLPPSLPQSLIPSRFPADGRPEDYRSMALHYENSMNYVLAGKFHHLSGDSTKVRQSIDGTLPTARDAPKSVSV